MKGYNTANGYMGYIDGEYQLFASETDYREYMEDQYNKFPTYAILFEKR